MLDFVIFAVTFVVFLLGLLVYLYPGSGRKTTIPGLDPSDAKDGNLADVGRAGSLHEFLLKLHEEHGPIARFYWGTEMVVSVGSPQLLKECSHIFDRPPSLFKLFEPLIGAECMQYANGAEGQKRRRLYDPSFSHAAMKNYYDIFSKVSQSLARSWCGTPVDQHVPLSTHMFALAIKIITQATCGAGFKDDKAVLEFRKNYDLCWGELENSLSEGPALPGSDREKRFSKSRDYMFNKISELVKKRRQNPPGADEQVYLDVLLESELSERDILCDALVMLVGGFHTTGNLLVWMLYFLATHQHMQDAVVAELEEVLGSEELTPDRASELKYTRRVIDETLRCAVIAPWAARYQQHDATLGGHTIPAKTPVLQALGVVLQNKALWPDPKRFDPDRHLPEKIKSMPDHAFEPFGFAGKRKCPGYRFSYHEVLVFCACVLRKVRVKLVPGQVIEPVFGLVTHPSDEVWVTVEKRN